jgi:hypothetical protein
MSFDWQYWVQKFIDNPGYNDTDVTTSEAIRPVYVILGAHRLLPNEDNVIWQRIYIDVLNKNNNRQQGAKVFCNTKCYDSSFETSKITIDEISGKIPYINMPYDSIVDIWHEDGEGVLGLKSHYSYLVVFKEIEVKPNFGGIRVTVNQDWVASLKPDSEGNVTFFVGIK